MNDDVKKPRPRLLRQELQNIIEEAICSEKGSWGYDGSDDMVNGPLTILVSFNGKRTHTITIAEILPDIVSARGVTGACGMKR